MHETVGIGPDLYEGAEVHHLDVTGACEHDIGWLDVAMHDAVTMRVVKG